MTNRTKGWVQWLLIFCVILALAVVASCAVIEEEGAVEPEPPDFSGAVVEMAASAGFKCEVDLTISYDYDSDTEHVTGSVTCGP